MDAWHNSYYQMVDSLLCPRYKASYFCANPRCWLRRAKRDLLFGTCSFCLFVVWLQSHAFAHENLLTEGCITNYQDPLSVRLQQFLCAFLSPQKKIYSKKKKKRVGRKLRATFSKEKCSFVSFLHQRAAMNHSKRSRTPKHWSKEKPTLLSSAPPFFFSFRLRQKRCHCPAGRLWGWCSRLQDDVL